MIRDGVVGAGWRAEFYLRIAALVPEKFEVTGIFVRNPDARHKIADTYSVKVCESLDELLDTGCDFVVSCVGSKSILDMAATLAEHGMPVLTETPAGTDLDMIRAMREKLQPDWKIQVAEQFHLQPRHSALQAVVDSGILGEVHHLQLSTCHGYHAVSLIRKYLHTGDRMPDIQKVILPDISMRYNSRQGISEPTPTDMPQTIATLTFGDKSAVYDFTRAQYFSAIRGKRILIRGEKGEIVNDTCTYLNGDQPMTFSLTRDTFGANGSLNGLYLRAITGNGQTWYRNPFPGARLTDEEVAIATCLIKMDEYLQGGAPFYPIEEALLDTEISLQL